MFMHIDQVLQAIDYKPMTIVGKWGNCIFNFSFETMGENLILISNKVVHRMPVIA